MAARLAQGVRRRYYTVKAAAAFGEGFGEGEGTRAGRSGYSARAQGAGALYIGRRRGTSGVEAVAAVHAQCAWGRIKTGVCGCGLVRAFAWSRGCMCSCPILGRPHSTSFSSNLNEGAARSSCACAHAKATSWLITQARGRLVLIIDAGPHALLFPLSLDGQAASEVRGKGASARQGER